MTPDNRAALVIATLGIIGLVAIAALLLLGGCASMAWQWKENGICVDRCEEEFEVSQVATVDEDDGGCVCYSPQTGTHKIERYRVRDEPLGAVAKR